MSRAATMKALSSIASDARKARGKGKMDEGERHELLVSLGLADAEPDDDDDDDDEEDGDDDED